MDPLCIKNDWSVGQVCDLLERAGLNATKFTVIDGETALTHTDDDLKRMGIKNPTERLEILNVFRNKDQPKVISDPVHGPIELHPLLVRIMDTPQFQRLRNIKQLGGGCFVYPGACHTRFEHSIGVAHLAGELARVLILGSKKRDIIKKDEERDILCVQIAGLCHDLGRGPFSHVFDDMFIKEFFPDQTHEEISVKMFDYLVEENGLKPLMKLYGLECEVDLTFITEMMNPKDNYEGRTKDKFFLYEIVSNNTNGVDVAKFDYFARDCHYLGLKNSFDYRHFLKFVRVCEADDGKTHICIRDKEVDSVYDIFQTRYRLHKRAYQHRVTKAVELMIKDALLEAKDMLIDGSDKKLCEATNNMEAYTKLTDRVFEQILYSTDATLAKAKEILERINCRDLYECLGQTGLAENKTISEEMIEELKQELTQPDGEGRSLTEEDFEIKVTTFEYGLKDKDPIHHTYLYKKWDPTKAVKGPQGDIPGYVFDLLIRVFYKKIRRGSDRITLMEGALERFRRWCEQYGFEPPDDYKPGEGEPWL